MTDVGAPTWADEAAAEEPAWTREQLMAALRAAGWKRMPGPAAIYLSPGGFRFHLDHYSAAQGGVAWRVWARRRALPQEEDV